MIDTIASVRDNSEIVSGYRLLALEFSCAISPQAGQFAMLKPHGSLEPLLRRALAVYRTNLSGELSFLYHVLGRGTEALSRLREGDLVDALLPLGNAWPIPGSDERKFEKAVVVSGGIGSASVLMLCEELKKSTIDAMVFFGAASESVARGCGLEDLRRTGLPLILTTDDGSLGEHGLITHPLERTLRNLKAEDTIVYTCGPWAMMKRVAEISAACGTKCYASLEAPMACGFGVCVGCVVAVNDDRPSGYHSYRRVCVDGSIFPSELIRWDVNAMAH